MNAPAVTSQAKKLIEKGLFGGEMVVSRERNSILALLVPLEDFRTRTKTIKGERWIKCH